MKKYVHFLSFPANLKFVPPAWRVPCYIMLGITAGLALAVSHIARVTSYMGNSPETCMNCHVMTDAYISWSRSSHANGTTCTDCHLPQDNFVHKNLFKAMDGIKHSAVFISGREPQVINLSDMAIPVVEKNCRRCHEHQIEQVHTKVDDMDGFRCWDCHRDVPHGKVRGQSTTPPIMRPQLPPIDRLPEDLKIGERKPRPQTNGD